MSPMRLAAYAATLGLVLSACATRVSVPEIPVLDESIPFKAAKREADEKPPVKIVEVPKPLPLPGQLKPVPDKKDKGKDDKQPKERVTEAHALAKIEPVKDGYINAIQVYPYTKGALYQLYAAPSQVTDIALEPGEKLTSVSAGDTARWVVGDTTSGEGKHAQVHILVKPIGADLETNLVIATDRRTYHLEMRSSEKTYMASVSGPIPRPSCSPSRSSGPKPISRERLSPTRASTSSSSGSATASRATRRGSRGRCSTTGPRSTSSSRRVSPRARRRRCS
jgi:type IV secretion system protein TrbG